MAITLFHGPARKLVLPLIVLSGVGWLVYVIGLGILFHYRAAREHNFKAAVPVFYKFWAAAVIGPFVYIGAVVHAALWGQISSIVGSVTAVLSIVYITAMGGVLHEFGSVIYRHPTWSFVETMFAGSFLACLFWAGVLAMWPWYTTGAPTNGQPHVQSAVTLRNETQSAVIWMNETHMQEDGTYEPTDSPLLQI